MTAALSFLSSTSKLLASTLDVTRALHRVGAEVVPAYADGLIVVLQDGNVRRVLLSAGRVPSFEAEPPGRVRDADHRTLLDFDLVIRNQSFGTMRVARDDGAAPFDEIEMQLLAELALRTAVAIDSARISDREHRVADTLQRALLPERLPATRLQRFDAAYLPATEEAIVGGDWYDAFALPDGRIALSIGDVAGHGLAAAIIMGEVRQAFRAAALEPDSPSAVLERANAIVNMRADPVMVTAIFGVLDPLTSTLTYAVAGHPPPLIALPDGTAERLPAGGIPLGIAPSVDAENWTFTLAPGAFLVCYTDGLIEYERDVIHGEARLLEVVAGEVLERHAAPARALLQRIFARTKNTDDAVVLVVAVDEALARDFFFEFSAIPFAVSLCRRALRRYADALKLDAEQVFALITAVGEAMANAVEHAYGGAPGNVRVSINPVDQILYITVEDDGRWKPVSKRDERGRGLPLIRALTDAVEIRTNQITTSVKMRLSCGPAVKAGAPTLAAGDPLAAN